MRLIPSYEGSAAADRFRRAERQDGRDDCDRRLFRDDPTSAALQNSVHGRLSARTGGCPLVELPVTRLLAQPACALDRLRDARPASPDQRTRTSLGGSASP